MAFTIGKVERVRRKVEFELPADTGKKGEKADFIVTFKVRDVETMKARIDQINELQAEYFRDVQKLRVDPDHVKQVDPSHLDDQFILEDVENIEGVKDASGNDVEFSADLLKGVMNDAVARVALLEKWRELNLTEHGSAKRKN